jgi:hypothetical protein
MQSSNIDDEVSPNSLGVWTDASNFPLQLCGEMNVIEVNKCGRRLLLEHLLEARLQMYFSLYLFHRERCPVVVIPPRLRRGLPLIHL